MDNIQSVGIREFRAHLHKYMQQKQSTIAITSHGEPIGYFIPAKAAPEQRDMATLQEAARQLSALLKAKGVSEDDIVADFQHARQHDLPS